MSERGTLQESGADGMSRAAWASKDIAEDPVKVAQGSPLTAPTWFDAVFASGQSGQALGRPGSAWALV